MNPIATLDAAGRPRSPATLPGYHAGRAPRNKGRRSDPPARPWHYRRVTSSRLAARYSSATAREVSAARLEWTIGDGSNWTTG
jgi:hypothetical protein